MLGILIHMCFNTEIFDLQKSLLPEKNGKKRRGGEKKETTPQKLPQRDAADINLK